MSFQPTVTILLNIASGVLLLAVGAWVLRVAPRQRANLVFALFSGAWGLRQVLVYAGLGFTPEDPARAAFFLGGTAMDLPFTLSLLLLAAWFPRPLARAELRLLAGPAAVAVALAAVGFWAGAQPMLQAAFARELGSAAVPQVVSNLGLVQPGFALALFALAVRSRLAAGPAGARERSQLATLSAGLVVFSGLLATAYALGAPFAEMRLAGLLALGALGLLAALWLRNAAALPGPERRGARNLAWLCLLSPLAGLVAVLPAAGTLGFAAGPQFGAARIAMVLLVAYAVVRYELLGIDLKVRWTVKQSTVAGALIGAFFLGEQLAQQVVSDQYGFLVGVGAAAALALTGRRLRGFADRVARTAVPPPPAGALDGWEEHYRAQVRRALGAEGLSRTSERRLTQLAAELGIPPERAYALQDEVVREAPPPR